MIVSLACIKQRQLKIEWMPTILTRALSWTLSGFSEYFYTGKEAKVLDNRYCVKFMQFGIGLLSKAFPFIFMCDYTYFDTERNCLKCKLELMRYHLVESIH